MGAWRIQSGVTGIYVKVSHPMYNTQNHWVYGLCTSSEILNNHKAHFGNWNLMPSSSDGERHTYHHMHKITIILLIHFELLILFLYILILLFTLKSPIQPLLIVILIVVPRDYRVFQLCPTANILKKKLDLLPSSLVLKRQIKATCFFPILYTYIIGLPSPS
jgi:hypothetical protein